MSKKNKKVLATTKGKKVIAPTVSKRSAVAIKTPVESNLLFGKKNYLLMLLGIAFIALGMALMTGGHMPSPDIWDEGLIYSFRRITLAPIIILIGLGIEVYAIFR